MIAAPLAMGLHGAGSLLGVSATAQPPGPGPIGGVPQVGPPVTFSVPSTAPTQSPTFHTGNGDTLILWAIAANQGTIAGVTDTGGDRFAALSAGGPTGPYKGSARMSLWGAFDVRGEGSDQVTVTLAVSASSYSSTAAAVVLLDIRGVGSQPVDEVGPVLNSTATQGGVSDAFSAGIWSGPNDLVLAAVSSDHEPNWNLANPGPGGPGGPGGAHVLGHESVQLAKGDMPNTVTAFSVNAGNQWERVWTNATANVSVRWTGEAMTLMPSGANPTQYPVTLSESGVTPGTTWSATVADASGSATAPNSISFSARSGTFPYSVYASHYWGTPAGGFLTVSGGPVTLSSSFVAAPPVQHVVVIVMEDKAASDVLANAPYEAYLAHTYGSASSFYGTCHGSYPNYLAMTSGRYYPCGSSSDPILGVNNLADLAEGAGDSWMAYFESMTSACEIPSNSAGYLNYHDPFILYKDIRYNASRCDTHVVNSAAFNQSIATGSLPAFSYYVPNERDDGHSSSLAIGDQWLRSFLSPILNSTSPAVQLLLSSTAFFVVYDEGVGTAGYSVSGAVSGYCQQTTGHPLAVCAGQVYAVGISPWSHATTYTLDASDFSVESTVEWLLGLGNDGGYDGTFMFPPMTGLFTTA